MKLETWKKILIHKRYFEQGYGVSSMLKYALLVLGFFEGFVMKSISLTFILMGAYVVGCYLFGYFCFHTKFMQAEQEISNDYNLFVARVDKDLLILQNELKAWLTKQLKLSHRNYRQ